jgi:putative heme iron utilization protein
MPNIYLEHPDHGFKIATMEQEAENDEQNGWTRYTIDTPTDTVEVVAEQVEEPTVEVVNTLKPKTRRKSA